MLHYRPLFSIFASVTCKSQDGHELGTVIYFINSYQLSLAAILHIIMFIMRREWVHGERFERTLLCYAIQGGATKF